MQKRSIHKISKPHHNICFKRKFSTASSQLSKETTDVTPSPSPSAKTKKNKFTKNQFKRFVTNPPRQILSGIQPTGVVHIGNLFGAVSNWVSLQYTEPIIKQQDLISHLKSNRNLLQQGQIGTIPFRPIQYKPVLYSVVDWHAFTIPRDADDLDQSVKMLTATLLGCGVDPALSALFIQSHVHQHVELSWMLTCVTPASWLYRMTQFKDKMSKLERMAQIHAQIQGTSDITSINTQSTPQTQEGTHENNFGNGGASNDIASMGLLSYPVLMAADILLYNATHIPVGDDQTQHLELTRDIARTVNSKFAPIFVEPAPIHNPFATRVMSLRSPENKMSKSDPDEHGKISLQDSDAQIQKKVKSAVTDSVGGVSYSQDRPGLVNLLNIYAATENMKSLTKFHKANITSFDQTFLGRHGMLSTTKTNSEAASRKLFDFAMNTMNMPYSGELLQTIQQNGLNPTEDVFIQAINEWESIANRPQPLVSPKDLALKHQNDLLSTFKPAVGDSLVELIAPIRHDTNRIIQDVEYLDAVTKQGAETASHIATETMLRAKHVVGIRPFQ